MSHHPEGVAVAQGQEQAARTQLTLCRVPAPSQAVLGALTLTGEVLDSVTVGEGKEQGPL